MKEMKDHYKETKQIVKEAYKKTKQDTKAKAKSIHKDVKKGLRAVGLMGESPSTGEASAPLGGGGGLSAMEYRSTHTTTSVQGSGAGIDDDSQNFRLAGIIWKRRSGLGKYSYTAPWERRRVVLQGTRLIYYKTLVAPVPVAPVPVARPIKKSKTQNKEIQS